MLSLLWYSTLGRILYLLYYICKLEISKIGKYKLLSDRELLNKIGKEKARKYCKPGRNESRLVRINKAVRAYEKCQ